GGLSLAVLLENPHGIDFGPLEPRIPACLSTPSGKIELAPEAFLKELGRLRGEKANGLVMVGRRQERTGNSWTHNIEVLVKGRNRCTLLMHPEDAAARGVATGDTAEVSSAVGTLRAPVEVTESIMAGVVSLPYGWGHDLPGVEQSVATRYAGVNSNRLTDGSIVDPISGNAVLNAIPVVVSRAG
ncbi:MAG: molybdopterin oxidoreductase family protein, partial [Acidimicrobiia bacterium]|nr:molybdopterin oxidoreductase family protein [Acidimicrobiia bacterium]